MSDLKKDNDLLDSLIVNAFALTNISIKKNKLIPMYEPIDNDDNENLFSIAYQVGSNHDSYIDIVEEVYQSLLIEYPEYGENNEL